MKPKITERPWGGFITLVGSEDPEVVTGEWVKILYINPGQRISLQQHTFRSEDWEILGGVGKVTFKTEQELHKKLLKKGDKYYIPKQAWHRIENVHHDCTLVVLEKAEGLCQESDIIRKEDDYGRT